MAVSGFIRIFATSTYDYCNMVRLMTIIRKPLLCLLLLMTGETIQAASPNLNAKLDSIRRVLPSLKGEADFTILPMVSTKGNWLRSF